MLPVSILCLENNVNKKLTGKINRNGDEKLQDVFTETFLCVTGTKCTEDGDDFGRWSLVLVGLCFFFF